MWILQPIPFSITLNLNFPCELYHTPGSAKSAFRFAFLIFPFLVHFWKKTDDHFKVLQSNFCCLTIPLSVTMTHYKGALCFLQNPFDYAEISSVQFCSCEWWKENLLTMKEREKHWFSQKCFKNLSIHTQSLILKYIECFLLLLNIISF